MSAREQGRAEYDGWHIHRDGSRFWAGSLVEPVVEEGELRGYFQVIHNLTERKRHEQAERERRLLNGVLDALPAGIVIADPVGRVLHANPAATRLRGDAPLAQTVEDNPQEGYWRETGKRLAPREWALARALQGEACPGDLIEIEALDGSGRTLVFNCAAPVRNANGEVTGSVAVMVDVSRLALSEEALRRNKAEIERLNARLRCAGQEMHSRIKNHFQVMAALVDMTREELGNTSAVQRLHHHLHTLAIIHDLRSSSATEDAGTPLVNARDALNRLLPIFKFTSGDRHIQANIADILLPTITARGLCMIVSECVTNAMQHTDGNVKISLRAEGDTARLEICDDGPGFPPDFDARKAAKMGLELIDNMARLDLRGDAQYESREEGGGRVIITFPLDNSSKS